MVAKTVIVCTINDGRKIQQIKQQNTMLGKNYGVKKFFEGKFSRKIIFSLLVIIIIIVSWYKNALCCSHIDDIFIYNIVKIFWIRY